MKFTFPIELEERLPYEIWLEIFERAGFETCLTFSKLQKKNNIFRGDPGPKKTDSNWFKVSQTH